MHLVSDAKAWNCWPVSLVECDGRQFYFLREMDERNALQPKLSLWMVVAGSQAVADRQGQGNRAFQLV